MVAGERVVLTNEDESRCWELRFPLKSLLWMERRLGQPIGKVFSDMGEGAWSLEQVVWLLAGALYHDRPKIAAPDLRSEAEGIIEELGFAPVMAAISQAIEQSMLSRGSDPNAGAPGEHPEPDDD